jgi:hypothetical protein
VSAPDPYASGWRTIHWVANTSVPIVAICVAGIVYLNMRVGGWLCWALMITWGGSFSLLTWRLGQVPCPHCGGRFFKRNGPHRALGSQYCAHCGIRIGTAKADAPETR